MSPYTTIVYLMHYETVKPIVVETMQQGKDVQESESFLPLKKAKNSLFIAEEADYSIVIPEPLLSAAPLQQLTF